MKKNRVYHFLIFVLFVDASSGLYCEDFFKIKKGIVDNAWKKAAFFYIKPAVTLDNAGYTSNIYYYQEMEEPDWTADLGLDITVSSILGNRFILTVDENPYYSFYAENVEQRALNNRLETTLYTYLGKFNLKYSYNTDYIKGRPTSEFGAYIRMHTQRHLVSLDYGKHESFFLNLFVGLKKIGYYEEDYLGQYDLKRYMSREELGAGFSLNKIIFTQTLLFLKFEYFEYKFDFHSLRDGWGRQASIGIAFPEVGRIKGTFELGIKYFSAGSSLYRDYTKPYGSGKVMISLLKRIKFEFQYLVDNFYSYWNIDQNFNERSVGTRVEYYINRNIKMGYNYHLGILSYESLTDGGKTREDNFYTSALYLGIRIFKKMGIGLEYRKYRAESDVLHFTRSSDFIGGYFIHEF